jgi:hypothetical protein
MPVQDAYAVIDTGLWDVPGGGGGGGVITVDHPAPLDPTLLYPPVDPNGYNPPPPQPIDPTLPGYPVPGNGVSEPPKPIDTVPNILTLGPVLSPANPGGALPPAVNLVPPAPSSTISPWLWVVAAMAGTYVVMKSGPQRAGSAETKRVLLPVLAVGGLGALLIMSKKPAAVSPAPVQSILPVSGGGGTITVDHAAPIGMTP